MLALAKETPLEASSLEERIRRRAYAVYSGEPDSALVDWLQAGRKSAEPKDEAIVLSTLLVYAQREVGTP